KPMGFVSRGLWVMGYGMHFPAHQVGGQPELWDIRGYGLSGLWVMTGLTVAVLPVGANIFLWCQIL
ncbi:hypothetical protein K443DRAFT_96670, partial [Laccaria amethystina LaAM-08-1]